jgi:polysaccharide deacetylase family protein (PEP-CTERM system associated)
VDVEDYFHAEAVARYIGRDKWDSLESRVVRNTERVVELLGEHNVRATFFVLGWVASRFPQLIREVRSAGHEIACHSYWHRLIYQLTPEEFREDTRRAKEAVETAAGTAVIGYRAPSFSITDRSRWALDILSELCFRYDSSVFPILHHLYVIH